MTDPVPFAYDDVLYPGIAFEQTHPNRLGVVASLFGMNPAPPSRCRVLELGCGVGANLMPMAYQNPNSTFLGIDLSAPTIEQGRARVAASGFKNIELRACNIMDVDASFGEFDYIIAHGVYSWVPDFVRAKVLSIFGRHLAPDGVGFVSFNAYPGSHLRDLGRRMMLYHVRMLQEPAAQVRQGRALTHLLASSADPEKLYGQALAEVHHHTSQKSDEVLYHDDLNPDARAFLLHQVVEAAERENLQYLSEALLGHSALGAMIEKGGGFVEYIPADQVVAREQYLDFFVGRWFHETLFCRADVKLERQVDPQRARDFYISAQMRSRESGRATDLKAALDAIRRAGDGPAEERMPLVAAALQYLDSVWPQAVDFSTLVAAAGRIVAQDGGAAAEPHMVEGLASDLYQAYRAERIQLLIEPPKLVTVSGERPVASFLAREQASVGPIVTNLRHETIRLDGLLRPFVMLMDGTRDIDALAPLLTELLAAQPVDVEAGEVPVGPPQSPEEARERVTQALEMVGKLGLLEE